jgi:nucleoside-diphosphate-sugar epimerase
MKKKILIIGSQGYLGTRLVEYLIERHYVCSTIDTGFFKDGILYNSNSLNALQKDAREITHNDIKGYTHVVLLAGISNDPFGKLEPEMIYNPSRDYSIKIATICKDLGVNFIFPSSCSVYGAASGEQLDEVGETKPQTGYSKNKLQIEEGLREIADSSFNPIALRFATIYGMSPRIRFDVVINMLCGLAITSNKIKLNSDGQAWRPNLHIDDACEAILCSIEYDSKRNGLLILNIGQDIDNYKIIDIAKLIQLNIPNTSIEYLNQGTKNDEDSLILDKKIQDGVDTRTYKVSFEKVSYVFPKFKCKWTVVTGIKDLIDRLNKVNLTLENFNLREFYRLQQIEYLHTKKMIDDNLRWL